MATRAESDKLRLEIPLDASGIKNFKPERGVKVVAFDSTGRVYEEVVKLDAKGKGVASLALQGSSPSLHVVVGPESASAEQLKGMQTISLEVSRWQWRDRKTLTVEPISISAYYWWWWFWWCRSFKVTGRVLCANGNPVPGAQVCAYDVDFWWWWWSKTQVGCATTDVNGTFEIDFTWCCGWWPWWWWRERAWLLEPTLAERISRLLREAKLTKIPTPGPQPDPMIFQRLLGEPGVPARVLQSHSLSSLSLSAATQGPGMSLIDPASLESLRTRLVSKLPPAPELERLRLWPWWPWWPWWDCEPDIIFRVTQNCRGQDKVIVDETIWDARLNIPTNLSVTLAANDQACCVTRGSTCQDGGECGFISDICEDNIGSIGGNPGPHALASQVGYLNPGLVDIEGDRPFAGTLPIRGCIGNTVDYYEFLVSTTGFAGTWNPLPAGAVSGFNRSYWDNGLHKWVDVPFPAVAISDGTGAHNVIESLSHYETNNGAKLWDAFTVDLVMELVTQNVMADGTYFLRLRGWTRAAYAGDLSNPQILPVCGSQDLTGIVVTIDNHLVTAGPLDLNGHRCGSGTVHQCTTEPDTEIVAIKILHDNGTTTDLGACGNVSINDTDMLQVDFVANDPDPKPHMAYYTLALNYDVNLTTNLLDPSLPGWTLAPSPTPPAWAAAAAQVGPNYGDANPVLSALSQGAASPHWAGGAIRLTVMAKAVFPYTCCYQLQLYAHKRTVGGGGASCDHSFWNQWNVTDFSFTITV